MPIDLPRPLTDYLNAKRSHDTHALLATLTADAVITDEGNTYTGSAAIRDWNARASAAVQATYDVKAAERIADHFVLTVQVAGNFPTSPATLYFYAALRGEGIAAMAMLPVRLPNPVAAYVLATNTFNTHAAAETFASDALVNDIKREFWGKAAIQRWFESESAGDRVTMSPTDVREHHGNVTLRAMLNGDYDKTGLPDPLELTYYFSLGGDEITQLIIIANEPAAQGIL
jgi:ketosteroid isomerase-like protein